MSIRIALAVTVALTLTGCDKPGHDRDADDGSTTADTSGTDGASSTDGSGSTHATDPTEGTGTGDETDTGTEDHTGTTADHGTTTDHGTSSTGADEAVCDADHFRQSRKCEGGVQYCATDYGYPEQKYFWGPCDDDFACIPGEMNGCNECDLAANGRPVWFDNCDEGTSTPLVLSFGGGPVRFASSSAIFDLGPQCGATDWPHAATPWLALDRDGSGAIESGRELFGSATLLRHGALADNGFTALAELDSDRDGKISASDPEFSRLLLWADHDGDRRSSAWELTPITDAGVIAISLSYRNDARCDDRANCEIERAAFTFKDARGHEQIGEVIDVHLSCQ